MATYTVEGDSFRAEKSWCGRRGSYLGGDSAAGTSTCTRTARGVAVLKAAGEAEARRDKVDLIQNFFNELRRIAPAGRR